MDTMTLEVTMPKDLYVALGFSRGSKAMSSGLVVSNAGPLITLAKIQRSQLLKDLFGRIVIPRAVFEEVVLRGAGQPGAEETRNASWQAGLLDAVKPVLTELQQTDFRASPRYHLNRLGKTSEVLWTVIPFWTNLPRLRKSRPRFFEMTQSAHVRRSAGKGR